FRAPVRVILYAAEIGSPHHYRLLNGVLRRCRQRRMYPHRNRTRGGRLIPKPREATPNSERTFKGCALLPSASWFSTIFGRIGCPVASSVWMCSLSSPATSSPLTSSASLREASVRSSTFGAGGFADFFPHHCWFWRRLESPPMSSHRNRSGRTPVVS